MGIKLYHFYVNRMGFASKQADPGIAINSLLSNARAWSLSAIGFFFIFQANATVTGPGPSWGFCRKINLSASTATVNFQVKITLSAGQYTNMNANGSDLRFYDVNNNVVSYYIETWNTSGISVVWLKVPVAGTNALYLYYGNVAAPALSNGAAVFDFFEDFTTSLSPNWSTIASGGSVVQSGTNVTLSNTNGGTVGISNTSPFTPSSSSFIMEVKHREVGYNRNRFYATNGVHGGSPIASGDYGYFTTQGTAQTNSKIFWNGAFTVANLLNNNTDYLTSWQITNGSTYRWNTYNYATGVAVDATARNTTFASDIRYVSISVTEVTNTSTSIDWIRVRAANGTFSEITGTASGAFINMSATIPSHTNVLCNGQSTGNATAAVSGGASPYSYSWNTLPVQNTQAAVNLSAGTYTITITDINGFSATASVLITEPAAVTANATSSKISCFDANDGAITLTGSNGISPYTYSIDNGLNYQAGNTFNNLAPGDYKPRVKDANGCASKPVQ